MQSARTIGRAGSRKRLLIIGSGWGGFQFLKCLRKDLFDVAMISPRNYFVFTPLLVLTSSGAMEFESVVEPIRQRSRSKRDRFQFLEATVNSVHLESKVVHCTKQFDHETNQFSLGFDKLLIASGALTNTFNIPGVDKYAHVFRDVDHGRRVRSRVMECFEEASMPYVSDEKRSQILHFVFVGGGPTGVELCLEIADLVSELKTVYPDVVKHLKMTIIDVAPTILSGVDLKLVDFIMSRLRMFEVGVETQRSVKRVDEKHLTLDNDQIMPYGLLVWATGLSPNPLTQSIDLSKDPKSGRILVDSHLRAIGIDGNAIDDIYAIGDCATTKEGLPCTAQAAKQEAEYLGQLLNRSEKKMASVDSFDPFVYNNRGIAIYGGRGTAAIELVVGTKAWHICGKIGGFMWRSMYWGMNRLWRNRILIPVYWTVSWLFGRSKTHEVTP